MSRRAPKPAAAAAQMADPIRDIVAAREAVAARHPARMARWDALYGPATPREAAELLRSVQTTSAAPLLYALTGMLHDAADFAAPDAAVHIAANLLIEARRDTDPVARRALRGPDRGAETWAAAGAAAARGMAQLVGVLAALTRELREMEDPIRDADLFRCYGVEFYALMAWMRLLSGVAPLAPWQAYLDDPRAQLRTDIVALMVCGMPPALPMIEIERGRPVVPALVLGALADEPITSWFETYALFSTPADVQRMRVMHTQPTAAGIAAYENVPADFSFFEDDVADMGAVAMWQWLVIHAAGGVDVAGGAAAAAAQADAMTDAVVEMLHGAMDSPLCVLLTDVLGYNIGGAADAAVRGHQGLRIRVADILIEHLRNTLIGIFDGTLTDASVALEYSIFGVRPDMLSAWPDYEGPPRETFIAALAAEVPGVVVYIESRDRSLASSRAAATLSGMMHVIAAHYPANDMYAELGVMRHASRARLGAYADAIAPYAPLLAIVRLLTRYPYVGPPDVIVDTHALLVLGIIGGPRWIVMTADRTLRLSASVVRIMSRNPPIPSADDGDGGLLPMER
jgi:hypothetical protein